MTFSVSAECTSENISVMLSPTVRIQLVLGEKTDTGHTARPLVQDPLSVLVSAHYTVHSAQCQVYCVLCTVYCVLCTVYCVLCTVYCVLCTVYCVLYAVYIVLSTVYSVQCTVYIVHCTVYSVQCKVHNVRCTDVPLNICLLGQCMAQDSFRSGE